MIEGVNKKKKKVTSKFSSEVAADGSKVVHKKTSPGSTVHLLMFALQCLLQLASYFLSRLSKFDESELFIFHQN